MIIMVSKSKITKAGSRKGKVPLRKSNPGKKVKRIKQKETIKLKNGYSMEKVDVPGEKVHFKLFRGQRTELVFTGLIAACGHKTEAIEIFNSHIPILGDAVLDESVVISKKK